MKKYLWIMSFSIIFVILLASCSSSPSLPADTIGAVKTDSAPKIDGVIDDVWSKTKPISINVSEGNGLTNGSTTVDLRATYTSDSIYFLAQWADGTESLRRSPWVEQADGSWAMLKDPNDKGGDNNLYYEDKMAFIWNINDSIAGFNERGCTVTCHTGEGKPFGNKYTQNAGEIGDIWHWKGVRTNPVGQFDDQYVDNTRYDPQKAPEAGRKSDPKTAGGYSDNKTQDGKLPQWALPANKPAPPYWIMDSEKTAFDSSKYASGNEVPGIVIAPLVGDRGDITAKGVWKDGKWTVEWTRKLQTGSQYDVQFSALDKTYYFGVSIFDNTSVRHARSTGANKLVFIK